MTRARPTCTGTKTNFAADPSVCDLPAGHTRSRCMTELGQYFDPDQPIDHAAIHAALEADQPAPNHRQLPDGCIGDHFPGVNPDCSQHPAADGVTGHTVDRDPDGQPIGEHDAVEHGCPGCAAAHPHAFVALPAELTQGLTTWGPYGGAQIRLEAELLRDPDGDAIFNDDGSPAIAPITAPTGVLYLAFREDADRSSEDGHPYRLGLTEARALRDLLNVATARGAL